eukprot:TRINITY_DN10443_c0_g1_i6.p1 TRINITY_DN10443_c0_g1~~TRINITY_DN10443_c0_g1_i6.p1  ORF type:complete len:360 (+),score=48.42 TRINITY_DN10443_c0_g1_i6:73-1152(+)
MCIRDSYKNRVAVKSVSIEDKLASVLKENKKITSLNFGELLLLLIDSNIQIPNTIIFEQGTPKCLIKFEDTKTICIKHPSLYSILKLFNRQHKLFSRTIAIAHDKLNRAATFTATELTKTLMINRNTARLSINTLQRYVGIGQVCKFLVSGKECEFYFAGPNSSDKDFVERMKVICRSVMSYVRKRHGVHLVYMKATFAKDECDNVWLTHADEIKVWINEEKEAKRKKQEGKIDDKLNSETLQELDRLAIDEKHKETIKAISKTLDSNFEIIRKKVGLKPVQDIESIGEVKFSKVKCKDAPVHRAVKYRRSFYNSGKATIRRLNLTIEECSNKKLSIKEVLRPVHRAHHSTKNGITIFC